MTLNTNYHRNKLKQLRQKRKDNELKQAIKRQEQRKKEEARIEAKIEVEKRQMRDIIKQMNKEQRQQVQAEQ